MFFIYMKIQIRYVVMNNIFQDILMKILQCVCNGRSHQQIIIMFSKYREVFTSWEALLVLKAFEVSYITHGHLKLKFTLCNDKELAI